MAPALGTSLKFRVTCSAFRAMWTWPWWPAAQGRPVLHKILNQGRQFWLDTASLGLACNPSNPCLRSSSASRTVGMATEVHVALSDIQESIKLACHCMAASAGWKTCSFSLNGLSQSHWSVLCILNIICRGYSGAL